MLQLLQQLYSYRFVYFNTRGAGELCRLTLAVARADWQDVRYPMAVAQSGFSHGDSNDYQRDAAAGAFDCNLGRLPILQVVEQKQQNDNHPVAVANIGQSHAICRFVAAQHGRLMTGQSGTALERACLDSLYESCRDARSAWYKAKRQGSKAEWFQATGGAGGATTATITSTANNLSTYCQRLERAIAVSRQTVRHATRGNNSNQQSSISPWCLGGTEPTLADVALYHLLGTPSPSPMTGGVASFMDGESERVRQAYDRDCPHIKDAIAAMGEHPQIQDWEARRPDTFS